jgi:Tfp pilus assembly protein PilV
MSIESNSPIDPNESSGFSLIETIIAMFIIMIAMLGALGAIQYSILYNAGNATRAQGLAILQQEVERLRSAKFTPAGIDNAPLPGTGACRADAQRDITAGTKTPCTIDSPNGGKFLVKTWVDNNPFNAAGTYDATPPDPPNSADPAAITRYKEITVEVRLANATFGWQSSPPIRVVLRRTIGN